MPDNTPVFDYLDIIGESETRRNANGFLTLRSHLVRNCYRDGRKSDKYSMESIWPPFKDGIVLLLYDCSGSEVSVCLRRSIRPMLALRSAEDTHRAIDGEKFPGWLWELPAGGLEAIDLARPGHGMKHRAIEEAKEEAGFELSHDDLHSLGPAPFSLPSICPERMHYFRAEVERDKALPACGDGHPMEEGATTEFINLNQALQWCRRGIIIDAKTEIGLRRFHDWWEDRK